MHRRMRSYTGLPTPYRRPSAATSTSSRPRPAIAAVTIMSIAWRSPSSATVRPVQDMTADAEEAVIEALRDLARWLYRQLEQEYEFQTSDAVVDEAVVANEYTFTETGHRFGSY